mmetsp:Transcript_87441/g.245448  ORF Transcript_87441/g.245448 Transcript_87441/m.245448 type:complete len:259 (+) Transcript_87441:65-841(+)
MASLVSPTKRPSVLEAVQPSQVVGARAFVMGKHRGTIRFVGETKFAPGNWIGVELDEPAGKNDGTVQGVSYFKCEPLKGLFCRPSALSVIRKEGGAEGPGNEGTMTNSTTSATMEDRHANCVRHFNSGDLSGTIRVNRKSHVTESVHSCAEEVAKLGAVAERLSGALDRALAREAAARAALAAKRGAGQAHEVASAKDEPTPAELSTWLEQMSARLEPRIEEQLEDTLRKSVMDALAGPIVQLQEAAREVRRLKPTLA